MKLIPLTQGYSAIVDDEDFERLSAFKWCYSEGYAVRNAGEKEGFIRMHWSVIGRPPAGFETDHRNNDGLDNQRHNLRHVTHQHNLMNKGPQSNNTSGYKGVYWHKAAGKWCAEIKAYGKRVRLGTFHVIEDAAIAYNEASKRLHGEFAKANDDEYLRRVNGR